MKNKKLYDATINKTFPAITTAATTDDMYFPINAIENGKNITNDMNRKLPNMKALLALIIPLLRCV